jgi:hypothetical protein
LIYRFDFKKNQKDNISKVLFYIRIFTNVFIFFYPCLLFLSSVFLARFFKKRVLNRIKWLKKGSFCLLLPLSLSSIPFVKKSFAFFQGPPFTFRLKKATPLLFRARGNKGLLFLPAKPFPPSPPLQSKGGERGIGKGKQRPFSLFFSTLFVLL